MISLSKRVRNNDPDAAIAFLWRLSGHRIANNAAGSAEMQTTDGAGETRGEKKAAPRLRRRYEEEGAAGGKPKTGSR